MSEFSRPIPDTAKDFVYAKSSLIELHSLDYGVQAETMEAVFKKPNGKFETLVIKKFRDPDPKKQAEECRFLSQTAATFREAGLPVLPLVKSILTKKNTHALINYDNDLALAELKPPYVVMSFLHETDEVRTVVDLIKSDADRLYDFKRAVLGDPTLVEGMTKDVAKMNALGFTRSLVAHKNKYWNGKPHPIESLWMFTENSDHTFSRHIVDINNLVKIKNLSPEEKIVTNPEEDRAALFDFFQELFESQEYEERYKKLYQETFLGLK